MKPRPICARKGCELEVEPSGDPAFVNCYCAGCRDEFRSSTYAQLVHWVAGQPIHLEAFDQCCPDFSCCGGTIVDVVRRQDFLHADGPKRELLMMGFSDSEVRAIKGEGNVTAH